MQARPTRGGAGLMGVVVVWVALWSVAVGLPSTPGLARISQQEVNMRVTQTTAKPLLVLMCSDGCPALFAIASQAEERMRGLVDVAMLTVDSPSQAAALPQRLLLIAREPNVARRELSLSATPGALASADALVAYVMRHVPPRGVAVVAATEVHARLRAMRAEYIARIAANPLASSPVLVVVASPQDHVSAALRRLAADAAAAPGSRTVAAVLAPSKASLDALRNAFLEESSQQSRTEVITAFAGAMPRLPLVVRVHFERSPSGQPVQVARVFDTSHGRMTHRRLVSWILGQDSQQLPRTPPSPPPPPPRVIHQVHALADTAALYDACYDAPDGAVCVVYVFSMFGGPAVAASDEPSKAQRSAREAWADASTRLQRSPATRAVGDLSMDTVSEAALAQLTQFWIDGDAHPRFLTEFGIRGTDLPCVLVMTRTRASRTDPDAPRLAFTVYDGPFVTSRIEAAVVHAINTLHASPPSRASDGVEMWPAVTRKRIGGSLPFGVHWPMLDPQGGQTTHVPVVQRTRRRG